MAALRAGRRLRPPPRLMERSLRRWAAGELAPALARLRAAEAASRSRPAPTALSAAMPWLRWGLWPSEVELSRGMAPTGLR